MVTNDTLSPFLSSTAMVFMVAGVMVPVFQKMRIPPTLGYVLAGILLGPFGLIRLAPEGFTGVALHQGNILSLLAELGIMALLFMIGLELSLDRLRDMRRLVLGLGNTQILATGAMIGGISMMFGNPISTSVLLGVCLALSSTAMVMQTMGENNLTAKPLGVLCFSVLLMQDLAVVPLLILVGALTTGPTSHQDLGPLIVESLLGAGLVLVSMMVLGRWLLRPLMRSVSAARNSEWLMAFVLLSVSAAALITHKAGLSPALGAFLAGLVVAETAYRHEVHVILEPLKGLLLGIFFLSVGMAIDVGAVFDHPLWLMGSVVGLFLIKAVVFYPLARLWGVAHGMAVEGALILAQAGEFAFVLLGMMMTGGLLNFADGQFFLLVVALSMMTSPLVFHWAPHIRAFLDPKAPEGATYHPPSPFILVVGLGRVGRCIAQSLKDNHRPHLAMDRHLSAVHHAQKEGISAFYGDIRNVQHVHHAVNAGASVIILAVDSLPLTRDVVETIHRHYPTLPLIVRAHNKESIDDLYALGASVVVAEDVGLAEKLLAGLDHSAVWDGHDKQ
jgi:CPA2 family monovalent cation:H+ antiporter-2